MNSKIFQIDGVGGVEVVKHHAARRITIKLSANKLPRVTIPTLMAYQMGYLFACEKKQWIIEHQKQLADKCNTLLLYPQGQALTTMFHTFVAQLHDGQMFQVRKTDSCHILLVPKMLGIEHQQTQQVIRKYINEQLRSDAKRYLPQYTMEVAQKLGIKVASVSVRNMVSRWGSCSSKADIHLNTQLMRLPHELVQLVVVHELCHIVHHNHSAQFHALVNKLLGGREAELEKKLKQYRTVI
ncbi:MAG: M48 family metallopeptidase [Salinivirgaceae bacterium]|nr:M48 family metallopeptidase [Salinivirgaceae bacterium]